VCVFIEKPSSNTLAVPAVLPPPPPAPLLLLCCCCCVAAEPILLDGLHQAVTLRTGDVVAVRTSAHPMPTYYGCFEHQMQLNPKSIHRPVLSSLVQVGGQCGPLMLLLQVS
jgi:hypothetical protein